MLNNLKAGLEKRLRSVPIGEHDGLEFWRQKIYYFVSLALVIFGFIAYIPSVALSFYHDLWQVALLDTIAYSLLLVLFFGRSIPFTIRVFALLFIIYALGVVLLLLLGTIGAGLIWLFAFPVLASILKGFRSAFIAILVNVITLVVFGILLYNGTLEGTLLNNYNIDSWTIVGINFVCLNVLVSIPIAVLINALEITLNEEKNAKVRLRQDQAILSKNNVDLKRINNDLDSFVYTASHDLKAPISNIEGLLDLLNFELGEIQKNEVKETVELIRKSILRFQQTIRSLTDVSKAQQVNIEDYFELLAIEEIYETILLDLHQLREKNCPVFHTDFKVKEIRYLKKDITSILYNLLSNAIKYCSPERPCEVWIRTEMKEDYFVLTVKDNGLGMKDDYKDKLFKMFKRLHDHVEGTGIGLYIVKRIVENHGGIIEVESQLNKGSEFRIFLKA
jgi:signal transduction histidine kinase